MTYCVNRREAAGAKTGFSIWLNPVCARKDFLHPGHVRQADRAGTGMCTDGWAYGGQNLLDRI